MRLTIPILLYHSVGDRPPERLAAYTVSRSQLASHLDRLVERGCSTLTVGEMVERLAIGKPLPLRPVVITFDDGFADFSTQAWPNFGPAACKRHSTWWRARSVGEVTGFPNWAAVTCEC